MCLGRLPGLLEGFGSRRAPLRVTPGPGHTPAGARAAGAEEEAEAAAAGSSAASAASAIPSASSGIRLARSAVPWTTPRAKASTALQGRSSKNFACETGSHMRALKCVPTRSSPSAKADPRAPATAATAARDSHPSGRDNASFMLGWSMPVRPCMGVSSPLIRDDGRDDTRAVAPSRDDAAQTVSPFASFASRVPIEAKVARGGARHARRW